MVRLRVRQPGEGPGAVLASAARYRISAGSIWTRPGAPLLRYGGSSWQHCGISWQVVELQGPCRLVLGPLENPDGVSEALDSLTLHERELLIGRDTFALYEPDRNLWRGVYAGVRWQAFSIESASLRPLAYGLKGWLPRLRSARVAQRPAAHEAYRCGPKRHSSQQLLP